MSSKPKDSGTEKHAAHAAQGEAKVTIQHPSIPADTKTFPKLSPGIVKAAGDNNLEINLEKLSRAHLADQRAHMVASDGCISNPGGPGC